MNAELPAEYNMFGTSTALRFAATLAILGSFALAGCGRSDLVPVAGVIQLDGQPLSNAYVEFQPTKGAPSFAFTDAAGRYRLQYSEREHGALKGKHVVRISTKQAIEEKNGIEKIAPERVPPQYNRRSELVKEITAPADSVDFQLVSPKQRLARR